MSNARFGKVTVKINEPGIKKIYLNKGPAVNAGFLFIKDKKSSTLKPVNGNFILSVDDLNHHMVYLHGAQTRTSG
jgi:hypothetical protein